MKRKKSKGLALAVMLLILMILAVIILTIGLIGIFNLNSVNNYKNSTVAYYAARAGAMQAVEALRINSGWSSGLNNVFLKDIEASYTISFGSGKYDSTNNIDGASAVSRSADGIYVPAGHAYIVSTGVYNGKLRRVAAMIKGNSSSPPWNYALFGYDSLKVSGTSDIGGDVGTNASSVFIGSGSDITGSQVVNAGAAKPPVTDPVPGAAGADITTTSSPAPGKYGAINLPGDETVTLSAGTYSFTSINLQSEGKIDISSGPVYIYVNGDLKLTGRSVINSMGDATKCIFYGTAGCATVNVSGRSNLYFGIYAPSAAVSFAGTSNVYGAVIGKTAEAAGTASIVYDPRFLNLLTATSGYLQVITWQNVY